MQDPRTLILALFAHLSLYYTAMRVFEAINSHTVERTKDKKVLSILRYRARNPLIGAGAGASEMIFNLKNNVLVLPVLKVILQR